MPWSQADVTAVESRNGERREDFLTIKRRNRLGATSRGFYLAACTLRRLFCNSNATLLVRFIGAAESPR